MDLLCHGDVVMKEAVEGGVVVHLGPVIRVVSDDGRRLALVEQGWPPCDANCKKTKEIVRNNIKSSVIYLNKKDGIPMLLHIGLCCDCLGGGRDLASSDVVPS
jgi:hypothetical protein